MNHPAFLFQARRRQWFTDARAKNGYFPLTLPGAVAINAPLTGNVTLDGTGNVEGLRDYSGLPRHEFLQVASAGRPGFDTANAVFNGQPVLTGNGSQFMTSTNWGSLIDRKQPATVYFACGAASGASGVFDLFAAQNPFVTLCRMPCFLNISTSQLTWRQYDTDGVQAQMTATIADVHKFYLCFVNQGGSGVASIYIDDTTTPSQQATNAVYNTGLGTVEMSSAWLFSAWSQAYALQGSIAGLWTYSAAHNTATIDRMFSFLHNQFGPA